MTGDMIGVRDSLAWPGITSGTKWKGIISLLTNCPAPGNSSSSKQWASAPPLSSQDTGLGSRLTICQKKSLRQGCTSQKKGTWNWCKSWWSLLKMRYKIQKSHSYNLFKEYETRITLCFLEHSVWSPGGTKEWSLGPFYVLFFLLVTGMGWEEVISSFALQALTGGRLSVLGCPNSGVSAAASI